MANAKQVIVLIGSSTKNLYKFVRWEIELALKKKLPIVAVNLNNSRNIDLDNCPAILKGEYVVHVPFKMKVIRLCQSNWLLCQSNWLGPNLLGPCSLGLVTKLMVRLGLTKQGAARNSENSRH